MSVASEESDDVEVEECGLGHGDDDGGEAEEPVVQDLLLAQHGVGGRLGLAHSPATVLPGNARRGRDHLPE